MEQDVIHCAADGWQGVNEVDLLRTDRILRFTLRSIIWCLVFVGSRHIMAADGENETIPGGRSQKTYSIHVSPGGMLRWQRAEGE